MCIYFVEMFPYSHTQALNDIEIKESSTWFGCIKNRRTAAMLIMYNMNFPESAGNSYRRAVAR